MFCEKRLISYAKVIVAVNLDTTPVNSVVPRGVKLIQYKSV